jgi:hypothetical protein
LNLKSALSQVIIPVYSAYGGGGIRYEMPNLWYR